MTTPHDPTFPDDPVPHAEPALPGLPPRRRVRSPLLWLLPLLALFAVGLALARRPGATPPEVAVLDPAVAGASTTTAAGGGEVAPAAPA
ncbi:hypothetical protein PYV61_21295, partial [Roseisolibacter sp. H3M3-2]